MASKRIGKYACLESERRYLLAKLPNDFLESTNGWMITDRYFPNTRLRLRRMELLSGNERVYKLTQKYRSDNQSASETTITNIYLTEAEYRLLGSLEGNILRKKRYSYKHQDRTYSIDVFEGRHQGLVLAELEHEETLSQDQIPLPAFAIKDVTDDVFFTGGNLVNMAVEEFRQGLAQRIKY